MRESAFIKTARAVIAFRIELSSINLKVVRDVRIMGCACN